VGSAINLPLTKQNKRTGATAMNMSQLKARVEAALKAGILSNEQAVAAYAALSSKTHYGASASNATRDRMLTNRFGV